MVQHVEYKLNVSCVLKEYVSEVNILWYKVQIYFKTLMVGDVPKSSRGYREHKWY